MFPIYDCGIYECPKSFGIRPLPIVKNNEAHYNKNPRQDHFYFNNFSKNMIPPTNISNCNNKNRPVLLQSHHSRKSGNRPLIFHQIPPPSVSSSKFNHFGSFHSPALKVKYHESNYETAESLRMICKSSPSSPYTAARNISKFIHTQHLSRPIKRSVREVKQSAPKVVMPIVQDRSRSFSRYHGNRAYQWNTMLPRSVVDLSQLKDQEYPVSRPQKRHLSELLLKNTDERYSPIYDNLTDSMNKKKTLLQKNTSNIPPIQERRILKRKPSPDNRDLYEVFSNNRHEIFIPVNRNFHEISPQNTNESNNITTTLSDSYDISLPIQTIPSPQPGEPINSIMEKSFYDFDFGNLSNFKPFLDNSFNRDLINVSNNIPVEEKLK